MAWPLLSMAGVRASRLVLLGLAACCGGAERPMCPTSCQACAGICVAIPGAVPFCGTPCRDDRSCTDGSCLAFVLDPMASQEHSTAVCTPRGAPAHCLGADRTFCDPFDRGHCVGSTLVREIGVTDTCATQFTFCTNGCEEMSPDGGTPSARCL